MEWSLEYSRQTVGFINTWQVSNLHYCLDNLTPVQYYILLAISTKLTLILISLSLKGVLLLLCML